MSSASWAGRHDVRASQRVARRLAAALGAAACAVVLGGCASVSAFFGDRTEPADRAVPVSAAASAAAAERADYRFEVVAPDNLRSLLTAYLDLARFQSAPAADGISNAELERLMQAAPAQAQSLLETAGYFNAQAQVERVANDSGKPLIRMVVQPGPQATVAEVTLDATGIVGEAAQAGDAAARRELAELRRLWKLPVGAPFRESSWSDAKNDSLARLRADGYPAATWSGTQATVDALSNTVKLALAADSGPLYRLGVIKVDGTERYGAEAVRRLATFSPGTPYSEHLLLDYQERLQKIGLFEGVSVELDASPDTYAAAPVLVHVKEMQAHQATFGVGYSANTGPRFSVEHIDRRAFGRDWIAKNKVELGPDLKSWQGDLTSYPLEGLHRNLLAANAERLRADDEVRTDWSARIGRSQDTPRIERLYYAEFAHARVESAGYGTDGDALSANYHWIFRDLDSLLLPTRGVTLTAQGALGYARGHRTLVDTGQTTDARGPFARAYGRLTWYRPLPSDWFATLRVEAGQVFTKSVIGVPDTLLFRAGGDGSVRGYAYRDLGPKVDGSVSSGRVLLTGSAEVATPISPRYPAFLWAAFVDAGNAANAWKDIDPAFGYGLGLRWRSPVGPLAVDLAYGQEVKQLRLHLSVGITF